MTAALTRRKLRVVLVKPWRVIFWESCSATPGSCDHTAAYQHSNINTLQNSLSQAIRLTWWCRSR